MTTLKDLKLAEKSAAEQRALISELNGVLKDLERCEKTIADLKAELEGINSRYQGPRSTREDVAYLTDLLACAKKKLTWEKHLTSLQKRTPLALERLGRLMNDPKNPPPDEVRAEMLRALQSIQAAMEKLQRVAA
jgi:chromosome segregation ATPase